MLLEAPARSPSRTATPPRCGTRRSRSDEGEIVSVIGPNGAGKSTLINAVAGLMRWRAGRITFAGVDLAALPSHQVCRQGIALVPEGRRLFTRMSVEENLDMGGYRAEARRASARVDRARLRALPDPARAAAPARRFAVGRPAADGGHRPRPDGPAAPAPARRAVARPRPRRGRPDVRRHPHHPRRGRGHPARGTERREGARHRRPRLRPGGGPHRRGRPTVIAAEPDRESRRPTSASASHERRGPPKGARFEGHWKRRLPGRTRAAPGGGWASSPRDRRFCGWSKPPTVSAVARSKAPERSIEGACPGERAPGPHPALCRQAAGGRTHTATPPSMLL